jgi:hypothetical protein
MENFKLATLAIAVSLAALFAYSKQSESQKISFNDSEIIAVTVQSF